MLQQHPAYRAQIDLLRSAFPGRVAATKPSDEWEHERWRSNGFAQKLRHYANRLDVLTLDKNEIAYVSGSLRPMMHRMLGRVRSAYLDIDDPLSLYKNGGRNSLKGGDLRDTARRLLRYLDTTRVSFWSETQLCNFLANFHAEETADLLATNRLSVLPPAIAPRTDVSNIGADQKLRCLCIASGKFWHKGVPDTIAAVDRLATSGVPIILTIVGADIAEDWQAFIQSRVHLKFYTKLSREDLDSVMRNHDVLVFPSHHDTYGWVLLEAKSFGLPAVVTDFYNRPEIVSHEIDGLLVRDPFANPFLPIGPAPYAAAHLDVSQGNLRVGRFLAAYIDDLAHALGKLAADRELLKRLGAAALASVQPQAKFGATTRIARLSPYLAT
jgi:glycosyltransferase involved in cell wall biosynthesis